MYVPLHVHLYVTKFGSFHMLTHTRGLFSRIYVHAKGQGRMASLQLIPMHENATCIRATICHIANSLSPTCTTELLKN